MRTRTHEIKIRLTDQELDHLNRMVAKTPYTREGFLRLVLAGYTIQECPKEYLEFRAALLRIGTALNLLPWNKAFTTDEKTRLNALNCRLWEILTMLDRVYTPYYKMKSTAKQNPS